MAGGKAPLLAIQLKGPVPLAVRVAVCPEQMDVEDGVTDVGEGLLMVTVPVFTIVVDVFAGFKPVTVTVYIVVVVGVTTIVCVVKPPGFHEKVGLVKFVLADMVAVCPEQTVALVTGAIKPQLVEPVPPAWLKLIFCAVLEKLVIKIS